jgi:hypothetical protein
MHYSHDTTFGYALSLAIWFIEVIAKWAAWLKGDNFVVFIH